MKIINLKTNHIINPIGFKMDTPCLSWVTCDTDARIQTGARIQVALDEEFMNIVHDSGIKEDINSLAYVLDMEMAACTRYYWHVSVWADNGDTVTSETAWFETSKMDTPWKARWITPEFDKEIHPLMAKDFILNSKPVSARAYICGLGLYEIEINGIKVSGEHLTPYCNAYDFWLQYQTFDITSYLQEYKNRIGIRLGNGWYKGRFGLNGGQTGLYGDEFALLCELVINCEDGSKVVIETDESFKCIESPVRFSGIYDGEVYDANLAVTDWSKPECDSGNWKKVRMIDLGYDKLTPRLSLPVVVKEKHKVYKVIHTPAKEVVLDFGQNMTGWVEFKADVPKDTELILQYGEILQDGCFYRDNLRSAKAEYRYISDGKPIKTRPYFTFYGFRYVKLIGFGESIHSDDFEACVLYSDMEPAGIIETSNPLVNRLFLNSLWGQKGNFLDVPTDCPQRDERLGWTGDTQMFAGTACYNMDCAAFYKKYMYDLRQEQKPLGGSVPYVVPSVKPRISGGMINGHGSAAWGDAATIIPWVLYERYGDKGLLERHFETMCGWVNYIKKIDDENGGQRLWKVGFHFGDWLALDNPDELSRLGGTDSYFVASAYYCYSAKLTSKAAKVLGETDLAVQYASLAHQIKEAIIKEYFTPEGRSAINTQTAFVIALYMDLVPDRFKERVSEDLRERLHQDKEYLKTGFVGTPYICRTLSEYGSNDLAYALLLNDGFPSWLYAVKMGATTIWERWNSVLPDGRISDTGMNSLNHYTYGSIVEWMYRNMCGINPMEEYPGFRRIRLVPQPYGRIKRAKAEFNSPMGMYKSSWEITKEGKLKFEFEIPFNTAAELILPDADMSTLKVNGDLVCNSQLIIKQSGNNAAAELCAGKWHFEYTPVKDYNLKYNINMQLKELMAHPQIKPILMDIFSKLGNTEEKVIKNEYGSTVADIAANPLSYKILRDFNINELEDILKTITVL